MCVQHSGGSPVTVIIIYKHNNELAQATEENLDAVLNGYTDK